MIIIVLKKKKKPLPTSCRWNVWLFLCLLVIVFFTRQSLNLAQAVLTQFMSYLAEKHLGTPSRPGSCDQELTLEQYCQQTFFACTFCFPNTNHVLILRRIGPLFCSLKRVHADIFMLACVLFNEQNNEPILLSISTWFVLGKQNVQAKKVYYDIDVCSKTAIQSRLPKCRLLFILAIFYPTYNIRLRAKFLLLSLVAFCSSLIGNLTKLSRSPYLQCSPAC